MCITYLVNPVRWPTGWELLLILETLQKVLIVHNAHDYSFKNAGLYFSLIDKVQKLYRANIIQNCQIERLHLVIDHSSKES